MKTGKAEKTENAEKIGEVALKLRLTGTREMLMHNERLRNPLDSYTRQIATMTHKKDKTDKDLAEIAQLEARGGMYETPDGLLGLPVNVVWSCLRNAGRKFKIGKDVERALQFTPEVVPVLVGGKTSKCDSWLGDAAHLDYRSAVASNKRVMRARAKVPAGWQATMVFTLLTDALQPEKLEPVIEYAGRFVGLCDWRPIYGTFKAEIL